jgi:hypothetical protein
MKRMLFLILLAVIGVIKVSAQEVDMSQENSADARIEELSQGFAELSQKLEQLQEDYDYLSFTHLIQVLVFETKIFDAEIRISSNEIKNWCYDSSFDIDLYLAYEDHYDMLQKRYNLFIGNKDELSELIQNLTFSDTRLDAINLLYNMLDNTLTSIENDLQYYLNYLNIYKKMGKRY